MARKGMKTVKDFIKGRDYIIQAYTAHCLKIALKDELKPDSPLWEKGLMPIIENGFKEGNEVWNEEIKKVKPEALKVYDLKVPKK